MHSPEKYTIAPLLLHSLFDMKAISAQFNTQGLLTTGMIEVQTEGVSHASMTVRFSTNVSRGGSIYILAQNIYAVSQEMFDKVMLETAGPTYFADWSALAQAPQLASI